ncbi:MAG: CinA family protein [Hyphomicrobiales bacterium]
MTFPAENDDLAAKIGAALLARGARVAVVETTAGGLISARLLSVPGASAWFDRGHVAYSGPAKRDAGADLAVLEEHGAVSSQAVRSMAEGLRALAGADFAAAESGIAGPVGSRRSPKPVGSVSIAVAGPSRTVAQDLMLPGTRVEVMQRIATAVLELLLAEIEG